MLLNKLLYWVSSYMKCKIIKGDNSQPYLERYMVARWGKNGEKTLFLHRFLDSDSDRGIHDHPWDSRSFIVAGGYYEKRLLKKNGKDNVIIRDIKPFSFNTIGKNDYHRIVLKEKTPAWTLFFHGKRVKHWGFQHYNRISEHEITKADFVPYEDKTDPNVRWEDLAPIGKDAPREAVDYIYKK